MSFREHILGRRRAITASYGRPTTENQLRATAHRRPLIRRLRDASDPHVLYDDLRRDGPVCSDGLGSWLVLGRAEVEEVLSEWPVPDRDWMARNRPDWLQSSMRRVLNDTMLNTNAPVHDELRKCQAPPLSARRVGDMRVMVAGFLKTALTEFRCHLMTGEADFDTVARLVPMQIIVTLLGLPVSDAPHLARLVRRSAKVTTSPRLPANFAWPTKRPSRLWPIWMMPTQ